MATREQIEMVLDKMEKANPVEFFKKVDETQAGVAAVLRLLYESSGVVTAGKISELLNVSTARVAVLLKKMVNKGLITKEQDAADGRVTIVKLTELGNTIVCEMREDMYAQVGHIIDVVGEERVMEFISIAEEIRVAAKKPTLKF